MRGTLLAALLVVGLTTVPVGAVHTSGNVVVNETGQLYAGLADDEGCIPLDACQDLEGISVITYDIGDGVDQAAQVVEDSGHPTWRIQASLYDNWWGDEMTKWTLCEYDGDGEVLRCHTNGEIPVGEDELHVNLRKDVETIRAIFLYKPFIAYYQITVAVLPT